MNNNIEEIDKTEKTADNTSDSQTQQHTQHLHEISGEDNLELRKMSFKERVKAKKERYKKNTEGMTKKEKLSYFVYYYKWHVILLGLAIFCAIALPITIYKNSRPVSLSYAIVNCSMPGHINKELFNEYAAYYNMDKGYQLQDNVSIYLNMDTYEEEMAKNPDNSSYNQFPLLCFNNHIDVIITDRTGLTYCTVNSLVQPLDDRLTDDILEIINTDYSQLIVSSPNYNDAPTVFAINISDTDFAKNLNLGYEEIFVCFPGGDQRNFANAKRFLNYVLDLNLDI